MGNLFDKSKIIDCAASLDHAYRKVAMLKQALTPAAPDPSMGGDPSMMGGAPPMDPSMMGGAPPMDPSMMGGAPPMDPSMMGPPPDDVKKSTGKKAEQEQLYKLINKMLTMQLYLMKELDIKIPPEFMLDDPSSMPVLPSHGDGAPASGEGEVKDEGPKAIPAVGDAKSLVPLSVPNGGDKTGAYRWGINVPSDTAISPVDVLKARTRFIRQRLM